MSKKQRMPPDTRGEIVFHCSSGFGGNSGQPFVQIEVGDQETQMSPEHARALAFNLLACAEAAESDAAIVAFCREMTLDEVETIAMLRTFRRLRDARHGKTPSAA